MRPRRHEAVKWSDACPVGRGALCDACACAAPAHRAPRSRAPEVHQPTAGHRLPKGRRRDRNAAALKPNLDPDSPAKGGGRLGRTGEGREVDGTPAPRHRPRRPCRQQKPVCTIAAHEGTLAAIAFNSSGSRLASASEKGTVIRVFSVPDGQKLYEFRRGMKRYVTISSLAFSMDSQFLCASSNTETVHIFKLEHLANSRPEEPSTWTGYMGKMFLAASSYLPTQVSDMMNQDRAFATGRLGFSGHRNICTLATIQKLPRLLVVSSSGHLYVYNLDPQDGGDCVLIKTHSLLGSGTSEENKENDLRPPLPQSYAATVARPSASAASTVPGYSEDGGALRGEVIPEHEFATGPVCLDDENEFPPITSCRGDQQDKATPS